MVFPPASLTVELSPLPLVATSDKPMSVPDFNKNEFAQLPSNGNNGATWTMFGGPRYKVSQIANAVASQGEILKFPAPSPNSSYELNFMAPALQCATVQGTIQETLLANVSQALNCTLQAKHGEDKDACDQLQMYLSWAPSDGDEVEPVDLGNTIGAIQESTNDTASSLFIGWQPTIDNSQQWNFINCSLYNASYHVIVNYTGGVQTLNVSTKVTNSVGYFPNLSQTGSATTNGIDPITGEPGYMLSTLNQFGYQAVMDSFGQILAGQISVDMYNAVGRTAFNTTATSVMTTSLTNTVELNNLAQIVELCYGGRAYAVCNSKATNSLLNITSAPAGMLSLTQAAEQLFENITLSLLSNSDFL
jgi:hypothetical protein